MELLLTIDEFLNQLRNITLIYFNDNKINVLKSCVKDYKKYFIII